MSCFECKCCTIRDDKYELYLLNRRIINISIKFMICAVCFPRSSFYHHLWLDPQNFTRVNFKGEAWHMQNAKEFIAAAFMATQSHFAMLQKPRVSIYMKSHLRNNSREQCRTRSCWTVNDTHFWLFASKKEQKISLEGEPNGTCAPRHVALSCFMQFSLVTCCLFQATKAT